MERVINFANFKVKFNFREPGIYSMGNESSQGKTYLCKLINMTKPDGVYAISSSDTEEVLYQLERFKNGDYSILVLDKFDFVKSKELINILESLKNRFILLDYKGFMSKKDFNVKPASMWYDGKDFNVYA